MINAQQIVYETSQLFRYGRFNDANKLLLKILKEDPNCFEARLEQIRSCLFQDEKEEASKLIGEAAALFPNDPRLVALQGIWFLENQQYNGAQAALSWAVQLLPEDSVVHLNLAITLRNLGQTKEAEKHIIKSLILNPASEFAHFEYSRILMLQGRKKQALEQMVKTLECNIYFIPGFVALTNYLKMQNQIDTAINLYEDAIKTAPDVEFFYGQLALLYEEKGDFSKALLPAKHLANTNNSYYDHLRVGIYTFLSGEIKEAENIFLACIKRDDKKWDAYYNLGEIYLTQKQIEKAKEYYQKATDRVNNLDSRPFNNLGIIALSQNDVKTAEEFFAKALKINPNSFEATLNMALLFKKRGDKITAKDWAQKAKMVAQNNKDQIKKTLDFIKGLN